MCSVCAIGYVEPGGLTTQAVAAHNMLALPSLHVHCWHMQCIMCVPDRHQHQMVSNEALCASMHGPQLACLAGAQAHGAACAAAAGGGGATVRTG